MGKTEVPELSATNVNRDSVAWQVLEGITEMENPSTGLAVSHYGQPGFEKLGFFYDNCVLAMILHAGGKRKEAERIIDYFVNRFRVSLRVLEQDADAEDNYGIVTLIRGKDGKAGFKALINAVDIGDVSGRGRGLMEFESTPGPMCFFIYAMLRINPGKYLNDALEAGKTLLFWQANDGGIVDGTRNPDRYYTEPHTDAISAFSMLYGLTRDPKWKKAADRAYDWFRKKVFETNTGRIYQGVWDYSRPNRVFAEDGYAWTMCGEAGERLSLDELKTITDYWISRCLVKIQVTLPDKSVRTAVLVDFSDPKDPETVRVRNGFHPMGSLEWTGGAILALQKNAVRFWNAGRKDTARYYKSIAEILMNQSMGMYYALPEKKGRYPFYATGQFMDVGPFGTGRGGGYQGWKTPVFHVRTPQLEHRIAGCSPVGAWPLLPYFGVNPFILNDHFRNKYQAIDEDRESITMAFLAIGRYTSDRSYQEQVLTSNPWFEINVIEPGVYNQKMWASISNADRVKNDGDHDLAAFYYRQAVQYASGVLKDGKWMKLAKAQNALKAREMGGIVWYPWGTTYPHNQGRALDPVLRYPLLNEIGATVYGMAVVNYELNDQTAARKYVEMLVDDYPLHQIPVIGTFSSNSNDLICGFWNALVGWEISPDGDGRTAGLVKIYRNILNDRGLDSLRPDTVTYENTRRYKALRGLKP